MTRDGTVGRSDATERSLPLHWDMDPARVMRPRYWAASAHKWTWQILPDYPYPVITFANGDWVKFKRPGRGNRGGGGPPPTMCGDFMPEAQAIFCRRRHQARRPPLAKIRPGTPAPTLGPGTSAKVPTPKAVDPLALRTRSP
jgi:hypothetical protein